MNIHAIKSDLRRYGYVNIGQFRVTGCKRNGFTLWRYVDGGAYGAREVVNTFATLEALLEAL